MGEMNEGEANHVEGELNDPFLRKGFAFVRFVRLPEHVRTKRTKFANVRHVRLVFFFNRRAAVS
jgi:hypothetical protein